MFLDLLDEIPFLKVEKKNKHRIIYDSFEGKGYINLRFGEDELTCISDASCPSLSKHE